MILILRSDVAVCGRRDDAERMEKSSVEYLRIGNVDIAPGVVAVVYLGPVWNRYRVACKIIFSARKKKTATT